MGENNTPESKKAKLDPKENNHDLYFSKKEIPMRLAEIASTRSKFKNKVGACIVDKEYRILGYGYNGHPRIIDIENEDNIKRKNEDNRKRKNEDNKLNHEDFNNRENSDLYICCAAQNAIHYSTGPVRGATLYITSYPCEQCVKAIVQVGIQKVIYLKRENENLKQNNKVSEDIFKYCLGKNLVMSLSTLMNDENYFFKPLTFKN